MCVEFELNVALRGRLLRYAQEPLAKVISSLRRSVMFIAEGPRPYRAPKDVGSTADFVRGRTRIRS